MMTQQYRITSAFSAFLVQTTQVFESYYSLCPNPHVFCTVLRIVTDGQIVFSAACLYEGGDAGECIALVKENMM
jgi:hypothetical protein